MAGDVPEDHRARPVPALRLPRVRGEGEGPPVRRGPPRRRREGPGRGGPPPPRVEGGKVPGYDFAGRENLRKFAGYEVAKSREAKEEPPHARLMRELELVDYEPGSDPGNL